VNSPAAAPFLDEKKSLACIHCGLCLGSCPTYLETGNENDSPRGRIYLMRALQDGRMPLAHEAARHIDLCLGCRACEAACPSGVQYGALLEQTREFVERGYRRRPWQRFLRRIVIEKIFPFPSRLRLALLPARLIQALRLEGFLPGPFRDALALLPAHSSAPAHPALSPAHTVPAVQGRAGFIRGCVMSVLFAKTNSASVNLLNSSGYDVVTPESQGCCGALFAHSGQLDQARDCARHNIAVFENAGVELIVINAAGCGSTLKEYGHLLAEDPAWAERASAFSSKVRDLTEVLKAAEWEGSHAHAHAHDHAHDHDHDHDHAHDHDQEREHEHGRRHLDPDPDLAHALSPSPPPAPSPRVTYHDACHLAHAQRITKPPRDLVRAVAGSQFIELPESDVCCGSAGSYNLTEPGMADRLQRRKVDQILKTGARLVVTTNPGCLLQIRAGLQKSGASHIRVLHIADYLEELNSPTYGMPPMKT
jgi:glycolate oxidase iron-sulfur subunit